MRLSAKKLFVVSWLFVGGCVGDSTVGGDGGPDTGADACAVGNEGCACTSGGACNPGLECLSKLCVNPNKDAGADSGPSDGGAGDADAASCANQPPFADPISAVPCTAPACLVSDGGSDYVKCESNGSTCTSTGGSILACSAGSSSCNSSQVCCLQGANASGSCPTLAVVSSSSGTACQSGSCPTGQIQLCNTTTQCKTGSCVYGALVLNGTKGAYLGLCQ